MTADPDTLGAQLTLQGWRRLASGLYTHPMLVPAKGSSSRARLLTFRQATDTQAAWDSAAAQLADIAVETA